MLVGIRRGVGRRVAAGVDAPLHDVLADGVLLEEDVLAVRAAVADERAALVVELLRALGQAEVAVQLYLLDRADA